MGWPNVVCSGLLVFYACASVHGQDSPKGSPDDLSIAALDCPVVPDSECMNDPLPLPADASRGCGLLAGVWVRRTRIRGCCCSAKVSLCVGACDRVSYSYIHPPTGRLISSKSCFPTKVSRQKVTFDCGEGCLVDKVISMPEECSCASCRIPSP